MKRSIVTIALLVLATGMAIASGNNEAREAAYFGRDGVPVGRGGRRAQDTELSARYGVQAGSYQSVDGRFEEDWGALIEGFEFSAPSTSETEGLVYMYEEEKLARDVYASLFGIWNYPIFANISSSEQQHMDAVGMLLDRYGIDPPATAEEPGVFVSETLQNVYDELVETGRGSLVDALTVGATIEDLDIADLAIYIVATDNADIAVIYQNLMKGSRNHLRSFTAQLDRQATGYEATYMSRNEFDRIVSTDHETLTITDPSYAF